MDFIDGKALLEAINLVSNWYVLFYVVLGLALGILLGSTPGLTGSMGIGILLGPTYHMDPLFAVVFLSAVYTGGIYGGGITAILLNVPGAPAAVPTTFDGYSMTLKGHQNKALGIGLSSSAFAMFVTYIIMLIVIRNIGDFVLRFGPAEMLMLVLFAITAIGLIQGKMLDSLIFGVFGLLLGTIGTSAYGRTRGTLGYHELYDGIPIVPALVGLFAVSEFLILVQREYLSETDIKGQTSAFDILQGMASAFIYKATMVRSIIIGFVIGLLPAAGSSAASIISYGQAQKYSKNYKNFGKGEPEGVVAAEAANNSSEAGSMIAMMTFGIPGSAATAILMGAFYLHGLNPGPYLVRDHLDLSYAVILSNLIQAIFIIPVALILVYAIGKIVFVPTKVFVPLLTFTAVVGTTASRGQYIDAVILFLFGILGYAMKRAKYPLLPLILGVLLGGMVDGETVRTYVIFRHNYLQLFERPIFIGFATVILTMMLIPYLKNLRRARKDKGSDSS